MSSNLIWQLLEPNFGCLILFSWYSDIYLVLNDFNIRTDEMQNQNWSKCKIYELVCFLSCTKGRLSEHSTHLAPWDASYEHLSTGICRKIKSITTYYIVIFFQSYFQDIPIHIIMYFHNVNGSSHHNQDWRDNSLPQAIKSFAPPLQGKFIPWNVVKEGSILPLYTCDLPLPIKYFALATSLIHLEQFTNRLEYV